MGFHDKIASKAKQDGEKASLYRQSAQKHANATWIYLIVTGAVWYFANKWWALIPCFLAVFTAFQSISATAVALRLEKMEKP